MKFTASAIALALMATGATAQQFNGAEIVGNYGLRTDGSSSSIVYGHGAVEFGFGNFAVQADLGAFAWTDETVTQTFTTIHAIYNVSDNFVIGAFAGYENWPNETPVDWLNLGIEVKYTFSGMPVVIEAFYLNQNEMGTPATPYEFFNLSVQYSVSESIDLTGGYMYYANGSSTDNTLMLAAHYNFDNGISVGGEYAQSFDDSDPSSVFTLSVRKSFGGGVTFGPRNWAIGTRGL